MTDRTVESPLSGVPGQAPREVTGRARRRSWGEGRVRIWWMGAAALALVTVYVVGLALTRSARDRWLMTHGVKVSAEILDVEGITLKSKVYEPALNCRFRMQFTLNGRTCTINDRLKDQREPLGPGMAIPLHVDPADPERHWTDKREVSYREDLLVAVMLLPLAALLLGVGAVKRAGVLRVWRTGEALAGVVVDCRSTPIAPRSRVVRFTVQGSRDGRIFTALVPMRAGVPASGEVIGLVAPPGRPEQAIVAGLYQA